MMSTDRIKGDVAFECDGPRCHEFFQGDSSFNDSWLEAKGEGWTARKESGEWMHLCPLCSQQKPEPLDVKKLMGE